MMQGDVAALAEISNSDKVYKYVAPLLFKKSEAFLSTAIKNRDGRDFEKRKMIIAGIYLNNNSNRLVGLSKNLFITVFTKRHSFPPRGRYVFCYEANRGIMDLKIISKLKETGIYYTMHL